MTQVDKLHAANITGKGIKIGIVDTGIDYNHPALGACFGERCPVVTYGWDVAGDEPEPDLPSGGDPDPYDGCYGHGTHVAGIIAARPNKHGFTGVAPGAEIGMFKSSPGCGGYTTSDALLAAMNKAFEAGSDIISCSAGVPSGWAEEPWAVVASRIVKEGVPVIVSAGNSGAQGLLYGNSPASGTNVAAIGSTDNTRVPIILTLSTFSVNDGNEESFGWVSGNPKLAPNSSVELPLWAASTDFEAGANACQPLPNDTPDLSGKITLVRTNDEGECTPTKQAKNIADKGGKYILYYTLSNT